MSVAEYTLLAFSSLFVIVDPFALIPAFLAMTINDTVGAKLRMAKLACAVAVGVLLTFSFAGNTIFRLLGITMPAFQFAGSILLMKIALDMLYAQSSGVRESSEEISAGKDKDDIAITPLAVPMLSGPGAISAALILMSKAETNLHVLGLVAAILLTGFLSYLTLAFAVHGATRLSPLALKLITRLMGLLLAALAVQFALNALESWPPLAKLLS